METQVPKPKRISGDEKRKRDIETLTNEVSQYNELFARTKRDLLEKQNSVALGKQAIENAKLILKAREQRLQEVRNQHFKEMMKLERTKTILNSLLAVDDLKIKAKTQKKEQSVQRQHDRRGGRGFEISSLDKLPLDVVLHIGEFLMHNVRTQYLEDVYNPFPIFNKLRINVKRNFVQMALLRGKYFSHLSKNEKIDAKNNIHFAGCKTINDEISSLIHAAKHINPEGAYKLIKTMCILFKKNKKYKDNWHTFHAEITRLKNLAN
jgi:hypothetical protein